MPLDVNAPFGVIPQYVSFNFAVAATCVGGRAA